MRTAAALLLALCSIALGQDAPTPQPPMTVFGLELSQPMTLQECPINKIGEGYFYGFNRNAWCYERLSLPKPGAAAVRDDAVKISFPIAEHLAHVKGLWILGRVVNGNLEGISFNTLGLSTQDQVLQSLTDKYGPPTESKTVEEQNRMGAKFHVIFASWKLRGLNVEFEGAAGSFDSGLVIIETDKGAAARLQVAKKLKQEERPL